MKIVEIKHGFLKMYKRFIKLYILRVRGRNHFPDKIVPNDLSFVPTKIVRFSSTGVDCRYSSYCTCLVFFSLHRFLFLKSDVSLEENSYP